MVVCVSVSWDRRCVWEIGLGGVVVGTLVSGGAVDCCGGRGGNTRCEGSGEGVSDCCRAVVPVGRVVTGSE